jgi:hypothetical protein
MKDTINVYQFSDAMAQAQHGFSYEGRCESIVRIL